MPIGPKFVKLFANQYERFLGNKIKGRNPQIAVPEVLAKFHPGASADEISLATNLVSEGQKNASRLNSQLNRLAITPVNKPRNPFIPTTPELGKRRHYTTEVTFIDILTSIQDTWAVSFTSPVDLSPDQIRDIAQKEFERRYFDSPKYGDDNDDANAQFLNAVVQLVTISENEE